MAALTMHLTHGGVAAVQGAVGSDRAVVAQLGLTSATFDPAPTLTALPGEFKRLSIAGGIAAAPNITHLTAYDYTDQVWSARGLGLYLEDGTLFAVFGSSDIVLSKAARAWALLAADIAFQTDLAASIDFGQVDFVWPPATEQIRGIASIARQQRVDAVQDGEDDAYTIVTPKTLRNRLAAFTAGVGTSLTNLGNTISGVSGDVQALAQSVAGSITTLTGRSITGEGLVSGGGDLSGNRTLKVIEATADQVTAGTALDAVITPRRLGPIAMLLQQNGFIRFFGLQLAWGRFNAAPNASTSATFNTPFPSACFSVVVSGVAGGGVDSKDNPANLVASTITKNGFSVFSADDVAAEICFLAVGY